MNKQEAGQSIIEVILATVVVALVLVAVLSTIVASLRNSRLSLEQTRATKYGEEVLEWVRQERSVVGWSNLLSTVGGVGSEVDYCLTSLPSSWTELEDYRGNCQPTDLITDTPYQRQMTLRRTSSDELEVLVRLTWPGKAGSITTELKTILARW